jgi:hypothetical protein
MAKSAYYRVQNKVWHWMPTCSQWPYDNYVIHHAGGGRKALCRECEAKEACLVKNEEGAITEHRQTYHGGAGTAHSNSLFGRKRKG